MLSATEARRAVRLTSDAMDEELIAIVHAGAADLATAGVIEPEEQAAAYLYDQALRMYLRGNFEPDAPEAEKCLAIYRSLKGTMKLSGTYREADAE